MLVSVRKGAALLDPRLRNQPHPASHPGLSFGLNRIIPAKAVASRSAGGGNYRQQIGHL
jgi:hypothetical protein